MPRNECEITKRASRIKLIICDLDCTLLNDEKCVSVGNMAAIDAARAKGIAFSFATSRLCLMSTAYIKMLKITAPVVTAGGAVICDPLGTSLSVVMVPNSSAVEFGKLCEEQGIPVSFLCSDAAYFTENHPRYGKFVRYNEISSIYNSQSIPLVVPVDYNAVQSAEIHKLLIACHNEKMTEQVMRMAQNFPELSANSPETGLVDVLALGVNKGAGVVKLASLMGLLPEEVCAFGDFYNDIPMLSASGLGFAVENACDELKREADAIVPRYDEDGVGATIEKYFLQRS